MSICNCNVNGRREALHYEKTLITNINNLKRFDYMLASHSAQVLDNLNLRIRCKFCNNWKTVTCANPSDDIGRLNQQLTMNVNTITYK